MPCECVLSGKNDYLFAAVGHAPLNCVCHFTHVVGHVPFNAPLPLNCSRRRRAVWFKHRSGCLTCGDCLPKGATGLSLAESLAPVSLSKLARRAQLSGLYGEPSSRLFN